MTVHDFQVGKPCVSIWHRISIAGSGNMLIQSIDDIHHLFHSKHYAKYLCMFLKLSLTALKIYLYLGLRNGREGD